MSLWYCHKSSEIIQTLACDHYDGFQHLSFIIFFVKLGFTILKII
jgi:hypothetical protein